MECGTCECSKMKLSLVLNWTDGKNDYFCIFCRRNSTSYTNDNTEEIEDLILAGTYLTGAYEGVSHPPTHFFEQIAITYFREAFDIAATQRMNKVQIIS